MAVFSPARIKRALVSVCVLFPLLAFGSSMANHDARVVWVTLPGSVLKVSPRDGSVALQLAGLKTPGALTVEGTNDTVWSYGQKAILGYDSQGNLLVTVSLPSNFHGGIPSGMAVDNAAGNIWIAIQKDLYRLDMGGQLKADIPLSSNATGVSLDADQSHLWVAEQDGIEVFDVSGSRLLNVALDATNPPTAIAYDPDLKEAWVLFTGSVARYDASGQQAAQALISSDLANFIAPDGQGGAWVGGMQNLARLDTNGQAQFVIQPFTGLSGGNALALAADPLDHSAWIANSLHLRHYANDGAFMLEAPLAMGPGNGNGLQQLGLYVDTIPPTVTIAAPSNYTYTNHYEPALTLAYSDIGSGVDPSTVAVTANGSAISVSCEPNQDDSGATCTPTSPLVDGGYTLSVTVKDYAGNVSKPATVTLTVDTVPPTITITSPSSPYTNQPSFTLAGSISEAGTLSINGGPIPLGTDLSFSDTITLSQGDNSFTFQATDLAGNVTTVTKTINLNTIPPIPVVNGDITVTGPTNGQVTVTGKAGSVAPNVSVTITDTKTGTSVTVTSDATGAFTATLAAGSNDTLQIVETDQWGNTTTDPNTIAVSNLPPDPASVAPPLSTTGFTTFADQTSFLYSGANPIQTGVASGAIDPAHVSVIRGKVMDANGNALPGVTISVLSHPEFGQTLSRADGYFDIAVNGGGYVTLNYALKGYLSAQRKVYSPWNAYSIVHTDVALIQPDPKVTEVSFGASSDQIVQGSVITDARGTRQATVYFPAGTTATMVMPDGSTQPLATGGFRATEYTAGNLGLKTMPAEVPTGTAYTYAVELNFDEAAAAGAQTIDFNQPVPVYVSNFLNFPVGYAVPDFYYDNTQGNWIASGNGDVIKVLSLDANGNAVLGVDGTGKPATAAELTQLGITTAELGQIGHQFAVGATFWRFALQHFCRNDFNPGNENPGVPAITHDPKKPDCPNTKSGCDLNVQNQSLGENIPVTGTPFVLRYDSDRQSGYTPDNIIRLQVTGATVPANLADIVIRVDVAGQEMDRVVTPTGPNQIETFVWDSHDRYGRVVYGQTGAEIHVGYEFNPIHYFMVPAFCCQGLVSVVVGAPNVIAETSWNAVYTSVGSAAVPPQGGASGINGWSLSVHHALDPATRTLYLGDGRTRLGSNFTTVVRKITGCCGYLPRPALQTYVAPTSIAVAANGDIYFSGAVAEDGYNSLRGIFKIDHATTTVTQVYNYGGIMEHMIMAPDGSFYYVAYTSTSNYQQIYRLAPDGTTSLVAGLGTSTCPTGANCAPGGPAKQADLQWIPKLSLGPDGTLYFLNEGNWDGSTSVSAVKTDGTWTKITPTYDNWVIALAAAPDGSVYFGGSWSYRIYQWKPDGSITAVAGNGIQRGGGVGDGGPALQADLYFPNDVYAAPDSSFYINDYGRIRRVGKDGIITTVAGGGTNYNYPAPAIGAAGLYESGALGPDGTFKFINGGILSVEPAVPGAGPIVGSQSLLGYEITSDDGSQLFTFDSSGRHLQTIDTVTKAVIYTFGYDAKGNFVSVTDATNRVTTINRDASGNAMSIVSPDGQVTTLSADGNGYLQSVADPSGGTYKMATRPDGMLTSFTDPRGNADNYSYDILGQLTQNQNAVGGGLTLGRTDNLDNFTVGTKSAGGLTESYVTLNNPDGTQSTINTAADGTVGQTLFNRNADSKTSTAADGTVMTTQYGADPRFGTDVKLPVSTSIKTPSGLTLTSTMSRSAPLSNPLDLFSFTSLTVTMSLNGHSYVSTFAPTTKTWTTTTPVGRKSTTVVDGLNRPVSVQLGNLNAVSYGYDALGHLQSVTAGTGATARSIQYSYYTSGPSQGYLQSVTDALNHTVGYQYDSAGRVSVETLPDGQQIGFGYDASGNLTSLTPPSRPAHGFDYDGINEVQDYTPPTVSGVTTPVTHYSYNLDRQLTQVTRPDGAQIALGYDTGGRLSTVTIPSGIYQYAYVPVKGQLQSITAPSTETLTYSWDGALDTGTTWSGPVPGSVSRTFDNNFRVTGLTVDGSSVSYGYDNDGLITAAGSETLKRDTADGFLTGTTLGTVTTVETYDGFGAPKTDAANAGSTALYSVTYTRDNIGRISGKTETINGVNHSYSYGYDLQGRLNSVTMDGAQTTYDYDANGNRTTVNGVTVGTYDDQDRLLAYGANSYTYTANGELLTKTDSSGQTQYTYDVLGNLLEVKLPNGKDVTYVVDGQNRRVGKQVNGTLVQGFLYQGQLNPVAELDGSGSVVQRYVYGTHANVPDYIIQGSNTYRVISDQLGSPRLIVDTTAGTVVEQIDYDAFGNVINDTNPGFQPFGYAGGLYDQDTKLIRFGARDYDPQTGRWTSKDPTLFDGGDSGLYSYAQGDPINLIDADGDAVENPNGYPVSPDVMSALNTFNQMIGCDKNIVITGGDRPSSSNLGAGSNSTHAQHIAADIYVPGQSNLVTANEAAQSGLFGGVGWYQEGYRGPHGEGPHVHVDLRDYTARWGFPASGPEMHGHFPNASTPPLNSNDGTSHCDCQQ